MKFKYTVTWTRMDRSFHHQMGFIISDDIASAASELTQLYGGAELQIWTDKAQWVLYGGVLEQV